MIIGKNVVATNLWYSVDMRTVGRMGVWGGSTPAQKRLTKRTERLSSYKNNSVSEKTQFLQNISNIYYKLLYVYPEMSINTVLTNRKFCFIINGSSEDGIATTIQQ